MKIDLTEFLSAYVAEVDEQLQTANAKLLEIDQHAREGTSHPRAVRDLFRALHTIKGLSAMVGVEPVVAVSHKLEDIVRRADRSGGRLDAAVLDAIVKGVRVIEKMVRAVAEGKTAAPAPKALLESLDAIEPAGAAANVREAGRLDLDESVASRLAPFERELLVQAEQSGRRAVRVDFSPSPAKAQQGFTINSVRERVSAVAEIVKVVPLAVPQSEAAPGGLSFALLLVAAASDDEIATAVGADARDVHALTTGAGRAIDEEEDEDAAPQRRGVVRVDVGRLDDAMEHLSTLIVTRSRMTRAIGRLKEAGASTRELDEIMRDHARQIRDLRSAILRVRMVPVTEVLDRIPLIVRGLQRASNKQVRVQIDAGNAELDKGVAERLFPALIHLVRNAFDHAIEPPDVRVRAGKPPEGTIRIACYPSNARVELTVSDDGMGVDRAAVRRRAGHDVDSDAALLDALCAPGFSTRDETTTTSGRGMGMDIVKRVIVEQLGGELTMTSERDVGTTFTLRVPLTISIIDAFTLDCGAHRFVVPVAMVEEIVEVGASNVTRGPHGVAMLERRGSGVPLLDLANVLGLPDRTGSAPYALVVRRAGARMAFALDRVRGQQETVVRPLVDPLVQVPGISGATDLGDGEPTLVLDLLALGASVLVDRERAA